MPSELTVKQAAAALGCSVRTVRRRIADGDLPCRQVPRGTQLATVIDAGDLAAWAQARGQTVAFHEGTGGKNAQTAAEVCDSEGQVPGVAPGQVGANENKEDGAGNKQGQTVAFYGDTEGHVTGAGSGDPAAQLAVLEAQVRALRDERDYLRQALATAQRTLEQATRALPPARDLDGGEQVDGGADRRPWWARLLGR
jgi:excisionase family DNA binding protein